MLEIAILGHLGWHQQSPKIHLGNSGKTDLKINLLCYLIHVNTPLDLSFI